MALLWYTEPSSSQVDHICSNTILQAGIVSWGIGCGEEGTPAVYANVATAVCWVDNEVKSSSCYTVCRNSTLQVKDFFGVTESRFGFLQTVDCNGAVPVQQCRSDRIVGTSILNLILRNHVFVYWDHHQTIYLLCQGV